jgi:hypothetical protein
MSGRGSGDAALVKLDQEFTQALADLDRAHEAFDAIGDDAQACALEPSLIYPPLERFHAVKERIAATRPESLVGAAVITRVLRYEVEKERGDGVSRPRASSPWPSQRPS